MKKFKKTKKYISIAILIIFVMAMIGCNNTKKADSKSDSVQKKEEITATDEIASSKLYDRIVQISNKVVALPAKYTDFTNAGAVLSSKDLSEDYIMDANSTKTCDMLIGTTKFELSLKNNSDKKDSLKNANVESIHSTQGKDIFFNGGIHVGSKLDDLTKKWGEPSKDNSNNNNKNMEYCYYEDFVKKPIDCSATGTEYTITIDRNTSIVTDIKYKWSQTNISDTNTLKTYSTSIPPYNEGHFVSFQVPTCITQQNQNQHISIYVIDNVKYIIDTPDLTSPIRNSDNDVDKSIQEYRKLFANDTTKPTIEILDQTAEEAHLYAYKKDGNSLKFTMRYITKDSVYISGCTITPYDANGTLTDSAISKFKDIISPITKSIHETKS